MAEESATESSRIFISYRRVDTDLAANMLYKALRKQFGHGQVFQDIDNIEPGDDFVERIDAAVGQCDILLALIGPHWLAVRNSEGILRLDDPSDLVRIEIEAALRRDTAIIPVLISGAQMPPADALPETLRDLSRRQAFQIETRRFEDDSRRLVTLLVRTFRTRVRPEPHTVPASDGQVTTEHTTLTEIPIAPGHESDASMRAQHTARRHEDFETNDQAGLTNRANRLDTDASTEASAQGTPDPRQEYVRERFFSPRNEAVRRLWFVGSRQPAGDFLENFYRNFSAFITGIPDVALELRVPHIDSAEEVAGLIHALPATDAIVTIPEDWAEDSPLTMRLDKALTANPRSPLILVDREPPRSLLRYANVSYIGVNNRRVGILAGYALVEALLDSYRGRLYVIADGPGGPDRAVWCKKTVELLDQGALIATLRVPNLWEKNDARLDLQRLIRQHPERDVIIFAGNDEAAQFFCSDAVKKRSKPFSVVGCDGAKGMRDWVDMWPELARATVCNDLNTEHSMRQIVQGAFYSIRYCIDPRLYPQRLHEMARANTTVNGLWAESGQPGPGVDRI